jgi:signal transduction histidine kinase
MSVRSPGRPWSLRRPPRAAAAGRPLAATRRPRRGPPIPVTVYSALTGRLPGQAESTAYFAAAEALTNIVRHSGAGSASVTARVSEGILVLEVRDDGRGGADPARGSGLTGLADRVAAAGGRMLLSSPPGGPTALRVEVPCTSSTSSSRPRSG